jgi:hypothetical protein
LPITRACLELLFCFAEENTRILAVALFAAIPLRAIR